jgi:hypothetical protein
MPRLRIIGAAIAALAFAAPIAVAAPRSPLPGWLEQMIGETPPAMRQQMRSPQMLQMMLSPKMQGQMRSPDARQQMEQMMHDPSMQQMMSGTGTMTPGGPMQGMMGGR